MIEDEKLQWIEEEQVFYKAQRGLDFIKMICQGCKYKKDYEELLSIAKTHEQMRKIRYLRDLAYRNPSENKFVSSDAIKSEIPIKDFIETLWGYKLTGNQGPCKLPGHKDRTPSFRVYPHNNSFYCFGCHSGGSIIDFVMKNNNMSVKESISFLSQYVSSGEKLPSTSRQKAQSSLIPLS